jgi:hypothetical protein
VHVDLPVLQEMRPMSKTKSLRVRADGDRPAGDGRAAPELEAKAWLARANCPETAVDVTEEQSDVSSENRSR